MPVYEYRCNHCQHKVALYFRGFSETSPVCPQCGGTDLNRLFSTFAVRKTYMDTYEDILSDNQLTSGMMQNNPRALAEWNRRMSRDSETETPYEYKEMLERMDAGEMPTGMMGGEETPEELE